MRFRWFVILAVILLCMIKLIQPPPGGSWSLGNIKENIKLGLDLQGGIFMQLEVDVEDALRQYLEEQAGTIKGSLEGEEFQIDSSAADFGNSSVTLKNVRSSKHNNVLKEVKDRYNGFWFVSQAGADITLKLKEVAKTQVQQDAVQQTVYKIQNRIGELGVTEPVITPIVGSNRIVLELAGADDVQRVNNIVREPGKLEWRLVLPNSQAALTETELLAPHGGKAPPGTKVFPMPDPNTGQTSYMLLKEVMLTARNVSNVFPSRDDRGIPAVGINLDREGGQIFFQNTGANVGNLLAIVLDGKILSAPVINSQLSERFIIQGTFTQREVDDMVVKIKSGSLPAQVNVLEQHQIGPTLGRDSIRQGTTAAIVGLILVVLFILAYYSMAGFFAFLALVLNLVIIMAMLSTLGAVLTLPGIAGFILTIGMAVDANVLIFERIREEIRAGTAVRNAVEIGYKTAFVTIMDANTTTFLAAFCLLLMGQGPIKGFAIMLMIGIICSIFTAVFCSRTFFLTYLKSRDAIHSLPIWPVWRGSKQPSLNS